MYELFNNQINTLGQQMLSFFLILGIQTRFEQVLTYLPYISRYNKISG